MAGNRPLWRWIGAAAAGLLAGLALPPWGCPPLLWLALIPWGRDLRRYGVAPRCW
jgi:apolipoprotein N-acyltransferase